MRELPRGTVTLLFTDIEGSTRLLHELGDEYAEVLAEHRLLLRDAFGRHHGIEVDTQGDAFFFAFERAKDAAAAARDGQHLLAQGPVRVRMGVHTGEPRVTDEGYVGADVHRAARIMSVGHGGQVLVSEATRALLDSDFALRDLGEHRLKDLDGGERIFQLGDDAFPPLKSLNNTNLPQQLEPVLGRKRELADLLRLVRREGARLVTLTGPGGIGKTRLALELASELVGDLAYGVWFVDLSAVHELEFVEPAVGAVLGARGAVADHIGDRDLGLVVDNFEQVVEASQTVARLLAACPKLVVVITSREPLHIAGEREYPLRTLAEAPAVELFRQRATAVAPQFEAPYAELAVVCTRLDFLPLAIELAAARAKTLAPKELRARLEQRLPLLSKGRRDAPERQRTLRATIDWSYELLRPDEQAAFARLAVFAGGWTLAAAETVCEVDVDTIESLVDKSLVRHMDGRYSMLETIREYASERLESSEVIEKVSRRHAVYYAAQIDDARRRSRAGERYAVLRFLDLEHENARTALAFFANSGTTEEEFRMLESLGSYWMMRGQLREGHRRVEEALARANAVPAKSHIEVLALASDLARMAGDRPRATAFARESLELARALGDPEMLERAHHELGESLQAEGDYTTAAAHYEQAVAVARESGETGAASIANLGDLALARGDFEAALAHASEAVHLERAEGRSGSEAELMSQYNCAAALFHLGRIDEARPLLKDALQRIVELGYPQAIAFCAIGVAAVAGRRGFREDAARLLGFADALLLDCDAHLEASDQRLYDAATSMLDELATAPMREEGRRLDRDQALALALVYLD